MVAFLTWLLNLLGLRFKSRARLGAENLALRHKVIVLNRKFPARGRLRNLDRLIFVWLLRLPKIKSCRDSILMFSRDLLADQP